MWLTCNWFWTSLRPDPPLCHPMFGRSHPSQPFPSCHRLGGSKESLLERPREHPKISAQAFNLRKLMAVDLSCSFRLGSFPNFVTPLSSLPRIVCISSAKGDASTLPRAKLAMNLSLAFLSILSATSSTSFQNIVDKLWPSPVFFTPLEPAGRIPGEHFPRPSQKFRILPL